MQFLNWNFRCVCCVLKKINLSIFFLGLEVFFFSCSNPHIYKNNHRLCIDIDSRLRMRPEVHHHHHHHHRIHHYFVSVYFLFYFLILIFSSSFSCFLYHVGALCFVSVRFWVFLFVYSLTKKSYKFLLFMSDMFFY